VLQTAGIFGNSAHRESVRLQKDEIKTQHARIIEDLAQRHRREMDTELHIIRRRYMLHEIELERKQLEKVTFLTLMCSSYILCRCKLFNKCKNTITSTQATFLP